MGLSRSARIQTLLVIDTTFFFIELIVGYATKSLALIADSFHMLNDVASLIVALYAIKLASERTASSKYTYGWQRAEILGALINGVFLLALCFSIFMEAIERFFNPTEVGNPKIVVIVGCFGLLSNIVGLFLFHDHGHAHGGHSHGHSHSHGATKSTKPAEDLESGHASRPTIRIDSHPHSHSNPGTPSDERQPLLSASASPTSHTHDKLPPYESDPHSRAAFNTAAIKSAAARKRAEEREREEEVASDEERMEGLLYGHPAQTRANLLRAAQEGFAAGGRKRTGSASAGEGRSSSDLGEGGSGHGHGHARKRSESGHNGHGHGALPKAGTAVGKTHSHAHGEDDGHAHGHGHSHAHGEDHEHDHDHGDEHEHHHEHEEKGHGGHSHGNMNMRGVFLHVLGDALGNVGVIVAGLIIWLATFPTRFYADPAISLIITIIIFSSALPLVRSASTILLQGVPTQISLDTVRTSILRVPGVVSLHELHVWSLSESTFVASVHIVVEGGDYPRVAAEIREKLHGCGIHSSTIQPEFVNERGELVMTRPSSPKGSHVGSVKDHGVGFGHGHGSDVGASGSGNGSGAQVETRGDRDREASTVTLVPSERDCMVQCVEESCRGSTCCPPPGTAPTSSD